VLLRTRIAARHQRSQQSSDSTWQAEGRVTTKLDKWTAEIPSAPHTLYFAQVIDKAGNVSVADNKGRYYELSGYEIYLPVALKTN
jgi:hypothetical protein